MLYFKDLDEFNVLAVNKKENWVDFLLNLIKYLNRIKFIEKELQKLFKNSNLDEVVNIPVKKIKKLEGNLKNGFIGKNFQGAVSLMRKFINFSEISNFGNRVRLFDAGRIHRSESSVKELVNKYD